MDRRTAGTLSLALALVGALASAAVAPARSEAQSVGFQVVVHPDNRAAALEVAFVRNVFLRKVTTWGDGATVRPVDLSRRSATRVRFARDVLKKSATQLRIYWNQQIFSGKGVPPPALRTPDAVIAYVLENPGAIGYVPDGTDPGGARVVKLR